MAAGNGGVCAGGLGILLDDNEFLGWGSSLLLVSLEFKTTEKDTNTHHSEQVVSGVGVIVDTTEEGSSSVLSKVLLDQVNATRVLIHERRDIVDEAGDKDQWTGLGLFLEGIPANDGQVVGRDGPFNVVALGLEFLEFHSQLTLLNFVLGEGLEVRSETEPLHGNDEPLSRIILIPLDGVAVVHGELMVEVVVTLTNGNESGNDMVTRSVLVVEGSLAKPVSKRVDTEGRLWNG
jgi:hypothetical protein